MRAMRFRPCGVSFVSLGLLAVSAVILAAPASAREPAAPVMACGTGISDARFSEAMALCGQAPAQAAAISYQPTMQADVPAPVSIAMPAERHQLARAERAVLRTGPAPGDGMIDRVGQRYGVDPRLLAAMVRTESGGRMAAVSNKGALGLMQVMPATARSMGVADPGAMLSDPELALSAGAAYLKRLQARIGNNVPLVVAAYNAGPGAVMKAGMRVPSIRETQGYVGQVMSRYIGSYGAP
jgi:soluble lytic murein transglycosylase-like protein